MGRKKFGRQNLKVSVIQKSATLSFAAVYIKTIFIVYLSVLAGFFFSIFYYLSK